MTRKPQRNWQELYYDGLVDYYDERDVSLDMKQGTNDCIKYIEEDLDHDIQWLKQEAHNIYYRKPYKPQVKEILFK
ncbi:MAG: hypothetical protein ACQEXX_01825 [Bacillota bacterium]